MDNIEWVTYFTDSRAKPKRAKTVLQMAQNSTNRSIAGDMIKEIEIDSSYSFHWYQSPPSLGAQPSHNSIEQNSTRLYPRKNSRIQ